jgi:hypothetical protein
VNYLQVTVQGLIGLISLTLPGITLLWLAYKQRLLECPFALILAASYVLSSILLAGFQFLSLTLLNPMASRVVAWTLVLAMVFFTCRTGWKRLPEILRQADIWERRSIGVIVVIVLLWLLLIPLSPYPAQLTLGLGDFPAYYGAATNLVAGRGWTPDYFVGDFIGGSYLYVMTHPILVLITTLFFQVFGPNWYSLHIYAVIGAGILVYVLVSVVCLTSKTSASKGINILFLTFAISLVPTHFIFFGLGVHTAPSALAFLTLAAFRLTDFARASLRHLVTAVCVIFLFWVRPEASLLAVLVLTVNSVFSLWTSKRTRRLFRPTFLVGCLVTTVSIWAYLPSLMNAVPPKWKNMSVFYLKFDSAGERFVPMYTPWYKLNQRFNRASFADEGAIQKLANPSIGLKLREHPAAFLRYLADKFADTAIVFVRTITFPEMRLSARIPALAILGVLLLLASIEARTRSTMVVAVGFLLLLPVLNTNPAERHILTVSPTIIGLSLRPVFQKWWSLGRSFASFPSKRWHVLVAIIPVIFVIVVDSSLLIKVRKDPRNLSYTSILRDIEWLTSPRDLIASSYPQLVTCMSGRRSIGATWLTENMERIVRKHEPEFILVDNAREGPENYTDLWLERGLTVPGYVPVVHNAAEHYIIFRSLQYETGQNQDQEKMQKRSKG